MSFKLNQLETQLDTPINVTVTGAAGNIGYSLIFMIAQGYMFKNLRVNLTLSELPNAKDKLNGVRMELLDGNFQVLNQIKATTSIEEAFVNCDYAILVGAKPRSKNMERKDLLGQNALIFRDQGIALSKHAKKTCKVLVVGNPANTNAMICSYYAKNLDKKNFSALTRLDDNRQRSLICEKLSIQPKQLKKTIIWGNHSLTQFPDWSHAIIEDEYLNIFSIQGLLQNISLDEKKEMIKKIAARGAEIIKMRGQSSAASAASASCDHIRDWHFGTDKGNWTSMGVVSDGSYGVEPGIVFSFPVIIEKNNWQIVQNLPIDSFGQEKFKITLKELLDEKKMAFEFLDKN